MKNFIANLFTRLFKAILNRLVNNIDLDLIRKINVAKSSADLIDNEMHYAISFKSRDQILDYACSAATAFPEGVIIELGVFKGESINKIASIFNKQKVHGFDTFTGLPENWRAGFDTGFFDVTGMDLNFADNCVLHQGLFDDTLPIFMKSGISPAKFIHVDCDLYSSTASALKYLEPIILPGTVLLFDEYFNYPGWENHEFKAFLQFAEKFNYSFEYIAYNSLDQQVALIIKNKSP